MKHGFKNICAVSVSKIPARGRKATLVTVGGTWFSFQLWFINKCSRAMFTSPQKQLLGESREVNF